MEKRLADTVGVVRGTASTSQHTSDRPEHVAGFEYPTGNARLHRTLHGDDALRRVYIVGLGY